MPRLRYAAWMAAAALGLAASAHAENDWQGMVFTSDTVGNAGQRLCMGAPGTMRPNDIGCPTYAPSLSTAGHVSITGNVSANRFIGDGSGLTNLNVQGDRITSNTHGVIVNEATGHVSLTTGGTTWGYLSSSWSYLTNLFTNAVSSTLVSATHISATYVDATRSGTVSGTYGYFRYISGTDIHGRFSGDGSGLTGVIAGATDRIISGTNAATRLVAISDTGYISITQAGANSGWFDPYRGLVTLGVSSTGPISGTRGYFSGNVGIGTALPTATLQVSGSFIVSTSTQDAAASLYVGANGRVGIGTAAPDETLHVSGSTRIRHTVTGPALNVVGGWNGTPLAMFSRGDGSTGAFGMMPAGNAPTFFVSNSATVWGMGIVGSRLMFVRGSNSLYSATLGPVLALNLDNKVGINLPTTNTAPLATLDVNGTISASDAIQVGQSSLACGSPISGSIRYSTSSDTLQVCTGGGWKSLVSGTAAGLANAASSTGAVQFNVGNALAGDTDNFFWDNTNKRLGIGTSSPAQMFDAVNTGNTGTATDNASIQVRSSNRNASLVVRAASANAASIQFGDATTTKGLIEYYNGGSGSPNAMRFTTSGTESMRITHDGRVGIGTMAPSSTLHVQATYPVLMIADHDAASLAQVGGRLAFTDANGFTHSQIGPQGSDNEFVIRNNNGGPVSIIVGGGYKPLHISSTGRIGINNVTDPRTQLDVSGSIAATDAIIVGQSTWLCSAPVYGAIRYNTTSNTLQVCTNGGWRSLVSGTTGIAAAASSTGAIQFNSADALGGDTDNLFWDNANKRLGIGTSSPAQMFDVANTGNTGTATDNTHIQVRSSNRYASLALRAGNSYSSSVQFGDATTIKGLIEYYNASNAMRFTTSGTESMRITNDGRVGIGSTAPTTMLDVSTSGTGIQDLAVFSGGNSVVSGNGARVYMTAGSGTGRAAYVEGGNSTGASNGHYLAFGTSAGSSTPSERMRIIHDGRVGIGKEPVRSAMLDISMSTAFGNTLRLGRVNNTTEGGQLNLDFPENDGTAENSSWIIDVFGNGGLGDAATPSLRFFRNNSAGVAQTALTLSSYGSVSLSNALQLGASSLGCSAGINGAIRYVNSINGVQVCANGTWTALSSNTTVSNAQEDRITSGTHVAVLNTATGYTSLSTAGTTWGYFGNSASFLPTFYANTVGIGTTAPNATLDVAGHVRLSGPTSNTIAWGTTGAGVPGAGSVGMKLQLYGATPGVMANGDYAIGVEGSHLWFNTASGMKWYVGASERMRLHTNGVSVTGYISTTGVVDVGTQVLGNGGDSASTPTYSWTGDTNTGMFTPGADSIGFTIGGTERMRISNTGNVGIGESDPTAKLFVHNTSNLNGTGKHLAVFQDSSTDGLNGGMLLSSFQPRLVFNDRSANQFWFDWRADGAFLTLGAGDNTDQFTRVTDTIIRVDSRTGNVGVGGSPATNAKLQVLGGDLRVDRNVGVDGAITFGGSNNYIYGNESNDNLILGTNNVARMWITSAGNVGIGKSPEAKLHITGGNTLFENGTVFISRTNTQDVRYLAGQGPAWRTISTINGATPDKFVIQYSSDNYVSNFVNAMQFFPIGTVSLTNAMQLGTSSLTCIAGLAGAVRYNATTGTVEVCTNATWTSLSSNTTAGTTGSGAANHIAYWSGASTLAHDANQLYWNATDNRMGIGTNSPNVALSVVGDISASSGFYAGNGTNALPAFSFGGDPDTGMYLYAANSLGFSTGGTIRAALNSSGLVVAGLVSTSGIVDVGTQVLGNAGDAAGTPTYSWTGDTNTGMFTPGADTVGFSTGGTEKVRILSNGNVGIGVTAPSYRLDISTSGSEAGQMALRNTANGNAGIYFDAANGDLAGGDYMWFGQKDDLSAEWRTFGNAGNISIMPKAGAGYVGIGTVTPTTKLHIAGNDGVLSLQNLTQVSNSNALMQYLSFLDSQGNTFGWIGDGQGAENNISIFSGPTHGLQFYSGGALAMAVDKAGRVGIGTSGPTETLEVSGSIKINTLSPYIYGGRYNDTSQGTGGFLNFTNEAGSNAGYGAWLNYNAVWNGTNWIQPRGSLGSSLFTANHHLANFRWLTAAAGGSNGGVIVPQTAMTLTGGSLGIGTSAPGVDLEVEKTNAGGLVGLEVNNLSTANNSQAQLMLRNGTGNAYTSIYTHQGTGLPYTVISSGAGNTGGMYLDNLANSPMIFRTNGGTERMRITNSGYVGIGTFNPTHHMEVSGAINVSGTSAAYVVTDRAAANNNTSGYYRQNNITMLYDGAAGTAISFNNSRVVTFNAYGPGTLVTNASGVITASSDERLKAVKGGFTRGLEAVKSLHPITYRWTKQSGYDDGVAYSGFSAQDVQRAIPEAVGKGRDGYLTVSDRPIIAASVNAIKQLATKISGHDEQIAELTSRNEVLEARTQALEAANDNHAAALEDMRRELDALKRAAGYMR